MTKRILAILLALTMIFSLWCVEIVAADDTVTAFSWEAEDPIAVGGYYTMSEATDKLVFADFYSAIQKTGAVIEIEFDSTPDYCWIGLQTYATDYPVYKIQSYSDSDDKVVATGSVSGNKFTINNDAVKALLERIGEEQAYQIVMCGASSKLSSITVTALKDDDIFTPNELEAPEGYEEIWSWNPISKLTLDGYTHSDSYGGGWNLSSTVIKQMFEAMQEESARFEFNVADNGATSGNVNWFGLQINYSTLKTVKTASGGSSGDVVATVEFDSTRKSLVVEGEALADLLKAVGEDFTNKFNVSGAGLLNGLYVYKHVDHSAEEWETDEDNHWKICETCGVKFGEEAHDKNGTVGEAIDATCTEKGKTAGVKCSVCDTVIEEPKDTDALGHDWATEWSKDTNGHYKACLNGCSEKNEEAEHTFESTDDGEVCSECGYVDHEHVFTEAEYDKDGHWNKCIQCDTIDEDSKEEHTLTYTSDGEDEHTAECDVCDYTFTEAHTWDDGEVTAEPTETEDGETTYTCEVCGETKTEEIPATGSEDDDTDGDSEDDDAEDDNTGDSTDGVAYDSAPVALYNNAGYTSFQDYTEIDQAALVAALNTPGAILTITFEVTDPTGGGWLKLVPNGSDWSDAQCFTAGTAESQGKGPFTATFTNLNLTGQAFQYFNNNSKSNTVITRIVVTVPTTSTEPEPPTGTTPVAHHHAYVWLGDATGHRAFCHTCRTFLLQVSAHVYVNGTCALCGYKDPNAVSGGNTSGATKAAVEIEGLNIDSGAFNAVVYDGNLPAEFFEAIQVEGSVVNIKTTIPSGSADWSKIGFQETKSGSWPYTDGISATITADEDGNLVFSVNGPELYAQLDGGTFVEGSVQLYLNVTNSDGVKSTGKPYTTAVVVNVPAGDDTIEVEMPQEAAVAKTADETVAD